MCFYRIVPKEEGKVQYTLITRSQRILTADLALQYRRTDTFVSCYSMPSRIYKSTTVSTILIPERGPGCNCDLSPRRQVGRRSGFHHLFSFPTGCRSIYFSILHNSSAMSNRWPIQIVYG